MKKVAVIIIILLMFLYATNPTKTDFVQYTEETIANKIIEAGVTSNSFLDQFIGIVTGKTISQASNLIYTRTDNIFYSVYEIEGIDLNLTYLGVARMFFPLKNIISSQELNMRFADIINLFDDKKTLAEDYYCIYEFSFSDTKKISIELSNISGPDLELYLFDELNYKLFKTDSDASVKVCAQEKITSGSKSSFTYLLEAGKYYCIVDNTDSGMVIPPFNFVDDEAVYRIKIDKSN